VNVAIFASAFYPHVGGVEELVRQLALEYRRRGMGVIVLTNRWPRNLPAFEEYEGIPVYRLPLRVPDGGVKAHVTHALTHGMIVREMLRILRRHSVDILHVQCVSSNGYYALAAREHLGLPLVVTTQGERTMDATGLYQRSAFMNRVLRALVEKADAVTACSGETLQDLQTWFGAPLGDRGHVVYNGIQLEDFGGAQPYAHHRPYVLGIGRLVRQKGFDVLIRAFAEADIPEWDLLIAGEGPERAALEEVAADCGARNRVVFTGRAERPKAVALFKGCLVFILPSRHEPFGIVNLEAMAAGKPVIATAVGGVPEVVGDGETGVLVPGEDVDAMAAAIRRLAGDAGLRDRLGAAGLQRVRQFTWPAIAEDYIQIYDAVTRIGDAR